MCTAGIDTSSGLRDAAQLPDAAPLRPPTRAPFPPATRGDRLGGGSHGGPARCPRPRPCSSVYGHLLPNSRPGPPAPSRLAVAGMPALCCEVPRALRVGSRLLHYHCCAFLVPRAVSACVEDAGSRPRSLSEEPLWVGAPRLPAFAQGSGAARVPAGLRAGRFLWPRGAASSDLRSHAATSQASAAAWGVCGEPGTPEWCGLSRRPASLPPATHPFPPHPRQDLWPPRLPRFCALGSITWGPPGS